MSGLWSKPAVAAVVAGGGESGGWWGGSKEVLGLLGCAGCGWVGCDGSGEGVRVALTSGACLPLRPRFAVPASASSPPSPNFSHLQLRTSHS